MDPKNLQILYIELYVSSLLAIIIYVLIELFKVEKEKQEKAPSAAPSQTIDMPRFFTWLLGIGVFLVIIAWLLAFGINEAVKSFTKSNDYEAGLSIAAKWLFRPGMVAIAISLLVFGFKAAIHPRAPAWFSFAGIMAFAIGILAFCISAAIEYYVRYVINSDSTPVPQAVVIAGLLNPFFFVGVPLGFYWLYRGKKSSMPRTDNR
jgi:magnesium-transporting ATPase (P-type)